MFKQFTKHFQLKKSPVPENLPLCHISDSDLKSSNAFKTLLIFISKHIAMIIGCFMIKSQICTESSFFVKDYTRHWGRMSCKPKPLPSWDLCCNRKCRLREVNRWINGILQMPWNWLAGAGNTDHMVRDWKQDEEMRICQPYAEQEGAMGGRKALHPGSQVDKDLFLKTTGRFGTCWKGTCTSVTELTVAGETITNRVDHTPPVTQLICVLQSWAAAVSLSPGSSSWTRS